VTVCFYWQTVFFIRGIDLRKIPKGPKAELRRKVRQGRFEMGERESERLSAEIVKHLATFLSTLPVAEVFLYLATPGEPNLKTLATKLEPTIKLALPVVDERSRGAMHFARWRPSDILRANKYGIMEPSNARDVVEPTANSVILVPALALDQSGHRLGHGVGFYDRFLAGKPCLATIGIVFDRFILPKIPTDRFDIPLTYLATERGVRKATL
jgi:5-formyltetrahydrofolate cyclo-ligase